MGLFHLTICILTFVLVHWTQAVPVGGFYSNPSFISNGRRIAVSRSYPDTTMMFTGYQGTPSQYGRNRATNVYAHGNTVGGGAYLGGVKSTTSQSNIVEPERPVSSAEAEAAPEFADNKGDQFHNHDEDIDVQKETTQQPFVTTESNEEFATTLSTKPKMNPKKKIPVYVDASEEDDNEEEEHNFPAAFFPFMANKRSRGYFPLNTYFPMIFGFPGGSSRSATSSSAPGMITAVANSYSTARGGVASSVATAYGGSAEGKKQRRIKGNDGSVSS